MTELIVALDHAQPRLALDLVSTLKGLPVIYKVGLELFLGGGPEFVREMVKAEHRVFLDLKFYDIPHQVAKAVKQASLMNVEMLTLHLSGGGEMVKAARAELQGLPAIPKLLGVSVLTSFSETQWAEVSRAISGFASRPSEGVSGLVSHASEWGVDGIVCSAHELAWVRRETPSLYTVVPGIRPTGTEGADDQSRTMTPADARKLGAHAIVVGRPITGHAFPRQAAESIFADLC